MVKNQKDIYIGKRKFLYYYTSRPSSKKVLIPDTPKALQNAIDSGATSFDTLSFCRYPDKRFPAPRQWGDLYITIQDSEIIENNDRFNDIKNVIYGFLTYNLKIGIESAIFNIFGLGGVGLQISSWKLRLEDGKHKLSDIYCHIAALLKKEFDKQGFTGFRIENSDRIAANISKYSNYSNALSHSEFFSKDYEELKALSRQRRVWNNFSHSQSECTRRIPFQIFMSIIDEIRKQQIEKSLTQLFKHCRFLNQCIKDIQDIPVEILPYIDDIRRLNTQELRHIFHNMNQKFTRFLDFRQKISPTMPSTCDQLKSLEICNNIECKRQNPTDIFDPNRKWPNPIPLSAYPAGGELSSIRMKKCAVMIYQKVTQIGLKEFEARDIHRLVRGTFPKMEEVRPGLKFLTDHLFLLRVDFPPYSYAGRRPSEWYFVNPKAKN